MLPDELRHHFGHDNEVDPAAHPRGRLGALSARLEPGPHLGSLAERLPAKNRASTRPSGPNSATKAGKSFSTLSPGVTLAPDRGRTVNFGSLRFVPSRVCHRVAQYQRCRCASALLCHQASNILESSNQKPVA